MYVHVDVNIASSLGIPTRHQQCEQERAMPHLFVCCKRLDIQIIVVPNAFLPLTSYDISYGIDAFIVGIDEKIIFIVGVINDIVL